MKENQREIAEAADNRSGRIHPLCVLIRNLRMSAGWTLAHASERIKIPAIVLGSYERGERTPPLNKIEQILNVYGYELVAAKASRTAIRLPTDMAEDLRHIAGVLENFLPGNKMISLPR